MHANQLITTLSQVKERIWTTNLGNTDLEILKRLVTELSSELEVHGAFEKTTAWLCETNQGKKGYKKLCAAHKNRIVSIVREVHGGGPNKNDRFQALQRLGTIPFMFIAASYTVVDISKMARRTFDRLTEVTPKYISTRSLPSGWILRTEFQVAVALSAEIGGDFKRSTCSHSIRYQHH
jgi:hypothetical protein